MKRLEIIVNEYPWRTDGKFDVSISEQPDGETQLVNQASYSNIDSYSQALEFVDKHLQIVKACERTRPVKRVEFSKHIWKCPKCLATNDVNETASMCLGCKTEWLSPLSFIPLP